MESFDGEVSGRCGCFNFIHSASAIAGSRQNKFFLIVDGSGTRDLSGISGSGGIMVDPDGTHKIWFEYTLVADFSRQSADASRDI